jgi:phosphate transport system permease protein
LPPRSDTAALTPPGTTARATVSNLGDRAWSAALVIFGGAVMVIAGLILLELGRESAPAAARLGFFRFLASSSWDPVQEKYGALPFIYGTLVTSAIAIVVALPVAVGLALFLSEMGPKRLRPPVAFAIEVLAAIPSVIFGLWGLFVMVPWLRTTIQPALQSALGFLPLFQGPPIGLGYLAGGLILAVMILPTISSVTNEVLKTVPLALKEGALALGATRWEAIRMAVIPYARPGIVGAALLGLGRALGETMAVTMVIGNSPEIHASLFAPGYSLPAVIANEFAEATSEVHIGALAALGLVLFGVTLILNAAAQLLVQMVARGPRKA